MMSSIATTQSMIDRLAIQHTLYFSGYIFFVVLAALFTWLLWRSGNRLQDAIREDAYARIEVAQMQAKQANERAANAHLLAQQLEHDNLVLKTQLVTIQERLADRHLSEEQKQRLAQALATVTPGKLVLDWADIATDGWAYGDEIATIFRRAGWDAGMQIQAVTFVSAPIHGLTIFVTNAGELPEEVVIAKRAFDEAGISIKIQQDDEIVAGTYQLLIGPR